MVDVSGRHGRYAEVFVPLHGAHQIDNAVVAVGAVEAFFDRELSAELVREALAGIEIPGRFEVVGHHPLVVLDGAHNPDALERVSATLDEEFHPVGSRLVVLGQLGGRDPDAAVAALTAMRPDLVVCTSLEGDRGVPAPVLAAACDRAGLAREVVADPAAAVARALAIAAEEDSVVITGSFRLLGPARRALAARG
jgi:dihydrofolate synthase/folylpolyglutamate synthase